MRYQVGLTSPQRGPSGKLSKMALNQRTDDIATSKTITAKGLCDLPQESAIRRQARDTSRNVDSNTEWDDRFHMVTDC